MLWKAGSKLYLTLPYVDVIAMVLRQMRHASINERADTNKFNIGMLHSETAHFSLLSISSVTNINRMLKDTSFFRFCRVLYKLYVVKNSHKQVEHQISRKESRTALMG